MRNITIALLLLGCFSAANCQTFKGTVYDQLTDSTISHAIVYISGTSVGTYSGNDGSFELDISRYSSMPITVSMLGYYSVTLTEHGINKRYDIYLSPKLNELNEVVVTAKKGRWETYYSIFKREFLGETENALECEILNAKDLRFSYNSDNFSYNSDSSTLRAFCSKPIIIYNKALGYTITYYLDKFKYSRIKGEKGELTEESTIRGNYLFKDSLSVLSESEKKNAEEKRKSAYLGSRMHFFRLLSRENFKQIGKNKIALYDNSPFSKGFTIGSETAINSDSLVTRKYNVYGYLKKEGELYVSYGMRATVINVKNDSVYFEKDGFYDPEAVSFSGDMGKQRIGDLLPYEYKPD
jgi:hypothetical protein